jgi:hypothetical protein
MLKIRPLSTLMPTTANQSCSMGLNFGFAASAVGAVKGCDSGRDGDETLKSGETAGGGGGPRRASGSRGGGNCMLDRGETSGRAGWSNVRAIITADSIGNMLEP